jgi:hypothetical protein
MRWAMEPSHILCATEKLAKDRSEPRIINRKSLDFLVFFTLFGPFTLENFEQFHIFFIQRALSHEVRAS